MKAQGQDGRQGGRPGRFLSQVPVEQALDRWFAALEGAGAAALSPPEEVPTGQALGRVLAEPAYALFSSPSYHACAMDGYAVAAASTFGASDTSPVALAMPEQACYVDTGDPLPQGFDAVIMIEDVQELGGGRLEIRAAATPWQHVRPIGEDVAAGEMLLPAGWRLRATDLAVLTSAGLGRVVVRRRPVVAVIPTGDEIVPLEDLGGEAPAPGQIIESNSLLVAGLAAEAGAVAKVLPVVPDDRVALRRSLSEAIACSDVVVLGAGSSAGSGDFSAAVLREAGEVVVHGVATRPGKPVILGVAGGKPVLGMPGYPVSAWLALDGFLRPLLARMLGQAPERRQRIDARLTRRVASPLGVTEYLRVKLARVGGAFVAAPLSRGAGVLSSLVRADGLVPVPAERQGFEAGTTVAAELLRSRESVERTVLAIGSHDMALDVLADLFARTNPGCSLASVNAGSLGGLQALSRDEAHIAGTHLLDERTGEYNVSFVRKNLPGRRVALFCLALREQGLLVSPGNPLRLERPEDLAGTGARLINRQRGAGTRVLLDYLLHLAGVDPASIAGYDRTVYTHLAVAAEVAGGGADAGMGILAAAQALGLDFLPVAKERYELAIPETSWEDPLVQRLLDAASCQAFRDAVSKLGGYDLSASGDVTWVEPEGA